MDDDDTQRPARLLNAYDDPILIHGATWRGAVVEERDWLLANYPAARPVARAMKGRPGGRVLDFVVIELDGDVAGVTFDVTRAFPDCLPPSDAELALLPTVEPS